MDVSTQPRHRRVRFGLRLLLIVIAILALALAWLGAQLRWIQQRREALQWILPLRARQIAAVQGQTPPPPKGQYVQHDGVEAPWSLAIFGEVGVERIEVEPRWYDSSTRYNINELRRLFPEAEVVVASSRDASSPPADGLSPGVLYEE